VGERETKGRAYLSTERDLASLPSLFVVAKLMKTAKKFFYKA